MAIGTMTLTSASVGNTSQTLYADKISMVGDGAYPTGGSTGVQTALRALTKDQRTILAVVGIGANGGYLPVWDAANGKLQLFTVGGNAGVVAAELANATDVSGTTFKLLVLSV